MRIQETKRIEMAAQIEAAHKAGMEKLRAAYPSEASQEALAKVEKNLRVELSEKMTTTGGRAMMRKIGQGYEFLLIRMNARLHELHPQELVNTYLHELAHIVANVMVNRNDGHGGYWSMVMNALGLPAERCHKMDTSALAKAPKRYAYKCSKCPKTFKLTPHQNAKHNRSLERGSKGYRCRCGEPLMMDVASITINGITQTMSGGQS